MLACKKDNTQEQTSDFFPPVQVNVSINLAFPQYSDLNNLQGFAYLPEGNKGIIVYHTLDDRFVAFDRTCSYSPNDACAFVSVDSSRIQFRCGQFKPNFVPCCGSKFEASSGIVQTGPARIALKQYFTARNGNTILISSTPL
jgi:nitrite reductase/ring-hydroxylating ferredoxin subunit